VRECDQLSNGNKIVHDRHKSFVHGSKWRSKLQISKTHDFVENVVYQQNIPSSFSIPRKHENRLDRTRFCQV
jgi:hypothetical protein